MMRLLYSALLAASMLLVQPLAASAARVVARVDLSSQTMTVSYRGLVKYRWKVSTARRGKVTPVGSWKAKWLSRHHRSSRYNNAPMPYSIFFRGGYAIHGTNYVKSLGRPASHGCVRLDTANAAKLYALVKEVGAGNTRIVVMLSNSSWRPCGAWLPV